MKKSLALVAALTLGLTSAPVQAASYALTFTGTLGYGLDRANQFGLGTNIFGAVASVTFTYTYPPVDAARTTTAILDRVEGGTFYGTTNPFTSTVTVNGISVSFAGLDYLGRLSKVNSTTDSFFAVTSDNRYDVHTTTPNYIGAEFASASDNAFSQNLLNEEFTYNVGIGDLADVTFFQFANDTGPTVFEDRLLEGHFRADTVSVVRLASAAVPEPATWALLILGFGAVGAGMRRRVSFVYA